MPNWCLNTLTVSGSEKELREFLDAVTNDDGFFDFERVVSSVDSKKSFLKKQYPGRDISDWNESLEQEWFNDIGYDWRIEHWGVKWNIDSSEIRFEMEEDSLTASFDTPYNPPREIMIALHKKFPKLRFELFYEEPLGGFGGSIVATDSGIVDDSWDLETVVCDSCGDSYDVKKIPGQVFVCPFCGHEQTTVGE